MRIVLLGPPGSGKSELSEMIADTYQIPIITQAGVVNTVAAEPGELGRLAAEARDASRVSDELLLALLRIQLPKMDLSQGYLLVDMPRDSGQADALDAMLDEIARPIDLVIKLDVDMDELMERLVGRISCDSCGAEYNLYVNPPVVEGVCDECGSRLRRRPGDYEETISNRLRIYEGQMGPLLQYYGQAGKLHRFDATGAIPSLWERVRTVIDATPSAEVSPASGTPIEGAEGAATEQSRPARKKVRKKVSAGKGGDRQKSTQKATAKKATGNKVVKKAAAKKATAKKSAAKKATVKKVAAKKVAAKKVAGKKVAGKKVAGKKVGKKATTKKAVGKKMTKQGVARKVVKKTPAKKVAGKKAVKKVVAKKVAARKVAKKTSSGKVATKKIAKKVVGKKVVRKKTGR